MKNIPLPILFFLTVVLTSISPSPAQADLDSTDQALNSIQVLLNLSDPAKLPQCSDQINFKRVKFCPLVSKCPANTPFCVNKIQVLSGGRKRITCGCNTSMSPIEFVAVSGANGKIIRTAACTGPVIPGEVCEKPYVGTYSILSGTNKVSSGTTNAAGEFTVKLEPGRYILSVPTPGAISLAVTKKFTVSKGKMATVKFEFNQGQRG